MDFNEIRSKDNEKIKKLRKLKQKKFRRQYGEFAVENLKIIKDASKDNFFPEEIYITREFFKKNKKDIELIIKNKSVKLYIISSQLNKSFSELETPSGMAAVYSIIKTSLVYNKPIIYLNGISDPGNMGTIIRTVLHFGFEQIVADEKCAEIYNPKAVQAAKDAIFRCKINFDKNKEILKEIKKKMDIYFTDVKKGKDISFLKKEKLYCIVFGSEADGVEKSIQKISKDNIHIKSKGKMESLNVAVAVGIIVYEISK